MTNSSAHTHHPPVLNSVSKEMFFVNIVPFFPDRIDYMASEALRLYRETGLTRPTYSLSMHPEGREPLDKVDFYCRALALLLKKLEGTPVRPGILLQSLMGHGWNGQTICGKDWQFTVNINGATQHRMCPLDPEFQNYVRRTVQALAALRPNFFLVDDDLRLINNSSNGLECFCPRHMTALNRATGRSFSEAELRKHMLEAPAGDAIADSFDRIRRKSLLNLARIIRSAIDDTDPDIPCGYCSGGREYMLMEELSRTLAGKNTPFLRIHNALYLERSTLDFPMRMYHTNLMKKAAGTIPILLDEADTCPHNRFAKSAMGMHAHITGGILNGLSGAKLWLTNIGFPEEQESREYEKIIGSHRGFYDALLNLCTGIDWLGPRTPLLPKDRNWRPAHISEYYMWHDLQWEYLNRFGIPAGYGDFTPAKVSILSGKMAAACTDEELKTILGGRVLVDGDAAFVIAERGLADLIGTVPEHRQFRFACEIDPEDNIPMSFLNDFTAPFFTEVKGRILTHLTAYPFSKSPDGSPVAPGSIYFENSRGGKIITTAVAAGNTVYNFLKPVRKKWLIRLFRLLDPESIPAYVENNQDVYFRCGRTCHGELIAAVINLSFDVLKNPRLSFPKTPPAEIWRLSGKGKWQKISFLARNQTAELQMKLHTYEPVILKISHPLLK